MARVRVAAHAHLRAAEVVEQRRTVLLGAGRWIAVELLERVLEFGRRLGRDEHLGRDRRHRQRRGPHPVPEPQVLHGLARVAHVVADAVFARLEERARDEQPAALRVIEIILERGVAPAARVVEQAEVRQEERERLHRAGRGRPQFRFVAARAAIDRDQQIVEVGLELDSEVAGNVPPGRNAREPVEIVVRVRAHGVGVSGAHSELFVGERAEADQQPVPAAAVAAGAEIDHRLRHQVVQPVGDFR